MLEIKVTKTQFYADGLLWKGGSEIPFEIIYLWSGYSPFEKLITCPECGQETN